MDDLIRALQIFREYSDTKYPTHCEHDTMYICSSVVPESVSPDHIKELDDLGFFIDEESEGFASFRFGSC